MNLDLRFYIAVFWRRFHYFAFIASLVSALSVATAYLLPPSYKAESTLLVEGSVIPGTLAEATIQTAATEQLQVVEQRLMTRANLLDIYSRLNVFPDMKNSSADDIIEAMRDHTDINLQSGQNQATIMYIAFTAASAQTAAAVVNEYVTLILKENVEIRTKRAGQTLEFFEQEVKQLGDQLGEASAKIVDFQNKNADALPNTLEFRLNQQSNQQSQLAAMEREIASLKDQKSRLIAVFNSTGFVNNTAGVPLSPEAQQLADLREQLAQAMAIFSAENPRVKLLQARVNQLEGVVKAQSSGAAGKDGGGAGQAKAAPPTMLEIQLADIDARVKALEDQKATAEAQLKQLTDSIDRTSSNQIELESLQREYDIIQGQYNTAVDRLSRAATGERIEMLSKGERITVIDAATPPTKPAKPNRLLIAGGGIFMGILMGLGTIGLIEFLNHSVRRPKDLIQRFGITPLTTIPYIRTPSETVMRRSAISGMLLLAVVGIPALLYAVHVYYLPIDLILTRVASKFGLGV